MENKTKEEIGQGTAMTKEDFAALWKTIRLKVTDTYEVPPEILWVNGSTIGTLGNFSASTGKAKSKKTFNISAIVAAALKNDEVLKYSAYLPPNKRKILYVDTELQITKSTQDGNISEVKAMHIRDREFDPFAFRINDNALPEVMDGYVFQQPKQDRNFPLTELTEQQHREALENGFGKQVVQGYSNVIAALKQGYASIGYERGRNVLVSLNKFLVNKRMIVKEGKGYRYNPDFHY